ncbi:MAG: hypothetical protein ACT4PL_02810, partial [Phycisphaerales bacterium]
MTDVLPDGSRKRLWAIALGVLVFALAIGLSTLGLFPGTPAGAGPAALLFVLITGGFLALGYFGAAVGLGTLLVRLLAGKPATSTGPALPEHRRDDGFLALALGPAAMLALSHGLGIMGLLSGKTGTVVSWVVVGGGLIALLHRMGTFLGPRPNLPGLPRAAALWVLPLAVMLVAASNPPGALWESEARGFDALSYHLQLPQEWARGERLWPLKHNVYSFLPSYMEAGYLHIAAMHSAGIKGSGAVGLIAGDGIAACACQLLHVLCAVACALCIARMVWRLTGWRAEAAATAGALALSVPWVLVVSTLAYNESAVNALGAGALLAAFAPGLQPLRRGVVVGLLLGAAAACKPTAVFFFVPLLGAAALVHWPRETWWHAATGCVLGGVLMVAPFLVRNTIASGNPIFPAATTLFGRGHWTAEPDQALRFAMAHSERASFIERAGLLMARSGTGLAATAGEPGEPRGVLHSQWSAFLPAGVAALALCIARQRTRLVGVALAVGVLGGIGW